jgi:hypothetical protein
VHADQLPVCLQKNELQEPAATGNGAARSETEVCTTNFIVEALLTTLLLGQAGAGDFGHAVDCRDRTRIDGSLERDAEGVTDRNSPLLHSYRRQCRPKDVSCGVNAVNRGAEVLVYDDSPTGIEIHAGGLQPETLGIRDTAGGGEERVREESSR